MLRKELFCAVTLLLAAAVRAEAPCGMASQQYKDCLRLVDSLRPDKGGQARVFAADGSVFSASQAVWMQAELRKVARLCASDRAADQAEAVRILAEVSDLLRSHRRDS
jgi:mannose/cellobiose epimerase-like protein (N-acyl-D-glucosamine 2-epimerase family)